jgi:hypothetical protein
MSIRHNNNRCVEERPATTGDQRKHSVNSVRIARATSHPQNKPEQSRTGRPTFKDDFLMEHSGFGQQADSTEFAGCF